MLFALLAHFTPGLHSVDTIFLGLRGSYCDIKSKAKGVDYYLRACLVNDAFVMDAWGKSQNAEALTMLADGNAHHQGSRPRDGSARWLWYGHTQPT